MTFPSNVFCFYRIRCGTCCRHVTVRMVSVRPSEWSAFKPSLSCQYCAGLCGLKLLFTMASGEGRIAAFLNLSPNISIAFHTLAFPCNFHCISRKLQSNTAAWGPWHFFPDFSSASSCCRGKLLVARAFCIFINLLGKTHRLPPFRPSEFSSNTQSSAAIQSGDCPTPRKCVSF